MRQLTDPFVKGAQGDAQELRSLFSVQFPDRVFEVRLKQRPELVEDVFPLFAQNGSEFLFGKNQGFQLIRWIKGETALITQSQLVLKPSNVPAQGLSRLYKRLIFFDWQKYQPALTSPVRPPAALLKNQ